MEIISVGDNLHEMSKAFFSEKNKKNMPVCRMLKILPRVLSFKRLFNRYSNLAIFQRSSATFVKVTCSKNL